MSVFTCYGCAEGFLQDDYEPLNHIADVIVKIANVPDTEKSKFYRSICCIAWIANGLGPLSLIKNKTHGVRLNALRNGPLDKKGEGSRILDNQAEVQQDQLDRLQTFSSMKTALNGDQELGLNKDEITRMMDANFKRSEGQHRMINKLYPIDRKVFMEGEWPVLLKIMGKQGQHEMYLAVAEVNELCLKRRLPQRLIDRLNAANQK